MKSGQPRVSILSPEFRYTNSAETDIRKTFAAVRKRMKDEAAQAQITKEALHVLDRVTERAKA